jgi:hypothetical protein
MDQRERIRMLLSRFRELLAPASTASNEEIPLDDLYIDSTDDDAVVIYNLNSHPSALTLVWSPDSKMISAIGNDGTIAVLQAP